MAQARIAARATASVAVCALGLAGAGCSLPLPMGAASLSGVDREPTGSIAKTAATAASPLSHNLDGEDWRRARAALATALDPQGNGATVAWDNPQSGRKGTFIPVAAPFPEDGQVCRAFIAKVDGGEIKEIVQGSACRVGGTDDWTVRDIKPFRQS
ncbi:MAG: RT0821/Lpp0805 family surface protein [Rhodoblastus sp.]|jgi:surface antigen